MSEAAILPIEPSSQASSIITDLLDGRSKSLITSVEGVLNMMCGSELCPPNGMNETGFKAVILSQLFRESSSQHTSVSSEELIQDPTTRKPYFMDILIRMKDRSRLALLELKYVPLSFVDGNRSRLKPFQVVQRREEVTRWKQSLFSEDSLDDVRVQVPIGDRRVTWRTISEHSSIVMEEQVMKYWNAIMHKFMRRDHIHLYALVGVGNRVHVRHVHYASPPSSVPRIELGDMQTRDHMLKESDHKE